MVRKEEECWRGASRGAPLFFLGGDLVADSNAHRIPRKYADGPSLPVEVGPRELERKLE
jgi:hypothetical protein